MEVVSQAIQAASVKARQETDDQPEPAVTGALSFPMEVTIDSGLAGAICNGTTIGYVNGEKGWLIYRGYNCFDLAEYSNFEETAYLLLYGRLPSSNEMAEFNDQLKRSRAIPNELIDLLRAIPIQKTHPMLALQAALALLGTFDDSPMESTVEAEREISIRLIAQTATIVGAIARLRQGLEPVAPDESLSLSGDFLQMMTGNPPDPLAERVMDVSLILHADHGMNASTFTAMVVNSSLSDMYSSVVAGVGSLKGPLHGGANEEVLRVLEEIGGEENVESWFEEARKQRRLVMGFGHRVYKAYDPRARIIGPLAHMLAEGRPEIKSLLDTAVKLEEVVVRELGAEKRIFPNVDFYSGLVYRALGIDAALFTPIFAVSRVAGWTARVLEYLADNRIFRPRAVYTGPIKSDYVSIEQRS
jgi:citrate synthase